MPSVTSRLERHFAQCAAIAATVGSANLAAASVHWSGPTDIPVPFNFAGVYLNVVTGAYGSSQSQVPGWTINPWGQNQLSFWINPSPMSTQHLAAVGGGAVANLSSGAIVGPSTGLGGWTSANLNAEPFVSTHFRYGFRFMLNGRTHYGRAIIFVGTLGGLPARKIVDFAWEDQPDMPINMYIEPLGTCCTASGCIWVDALWCAYSHGNWIGGATNCSLDPCPPFCAADVSGDGLVNTNDLMHVINEWGSCTIAFPCSADIAHNGAVDIDDLVLVITNWGQCPQRRPLD